MTTAQTENYRSEIAHDFNNILTAISGNLELYKVRNDPTEKDDVVAAAHESSQRAAKIVGQILVYARKSPLELKIIDANEPFIALKVLTDHLVPSNIRLSVEPLPNTIFVKIDGGQFVTALMNLVVNSVDALPSGGQISLSMTTLEATETMHLADDHNLEAGHYVVYEVTDNGSGIPKTILGSVLDPFFTTKSVGKGTGLGLSMVVAVAESTGGRLGIETSTAGTTMKIYVPILKHNQPAQIAH